MKKYNTINDVMTEYVNQTSDIGCASTVYFIGKHIFSYGQHYLLAELLENQQNIPYIIVNDKGYSVTTAKHISLMTRVAQSHNLKVFFKSEVCEEEIERKATHLFTKMINIGKINEKYISLFEELKGKYLNYCEFVGIGGNSNTLKVIDKCTDDEHFMTELNAKKQRLAEQKAEEKEQLTNFRNHKELFVNSKFAYLRIDDDCETVRTSKGTELHVDIVRKMLKVWQEQEQMVKIGLNRYTQCFEYFLMKKGDKITKIGCHNFKNSEILRFAEELRNN